MIYPKLSVVIPTRERSDTLYHTLLTVLEQSYQNLEIIVSDNASRDNTRDVVAQFKNSRISYINTGERIGMSENWEFALKHVTGDYVMFLGDDDGLLPNACEDISRILVTTKTQAIVWNKTTYNWPSNALAPNLLSLQCNYSLCKIKGDLMLRGIASGLTSYGRLPVLYSGFISMDVVRKIKIKTGFFFQSITPDVYSGIVLAEELITYLYSFRPFSINGGSSHSNGIASFTNDNKAQRFFEENTLKINEEIPIIMGSIQSHVAESFLQAKKSGLLKKYKLNKNRIHSNILKEILSLEFSLKQKGLESLLNLNLNYKNRKLVQKELSKLSTEEFKINNNSILQNITFMNNLNGTLIIDTEQLNINNSYDACVFLGKILGNYSIPEKIIELNLVTYVIIYLKRILAKFFTIDALPI